MQVTPIDPKDFTSRLQEGTAHERRLEWEAAETLYTRLLDDFGPVGAEDWSAHRMRATARLRRANALMELERWDEARGALDGALDDAKASGDGDVLAQALLAAGVYATNRGDMARAEAFLMDALARYHRADDRVSLQGRGWAFLSLASLYGKTGRLDLAFVTFTKAQDVLAQVKAGKDFASLAKEYSEDASASKGGDVGWIQRGQTEKQFEDVAFSLPPGQVSGLIKTDYGIDIIKVLQKQTAHLETFDEVKDQLRAELEKQKMADVQQNFANNLGQQLKSDPQHFDAIAKKAGLEVKETPLFRYRQVIPDFGNSESFANLAFQLRPSEVGQPFDVPKGTAIIQLQKIVPPHVQSFEQVRAVVAEDYRAAQSRVLAHQAAQTFAAQAKSGDFKALAKGMGLTVKESQDFTEQGSVEGLGPASSLASAFTLDPGNTSSVVNVNGNDVVFKVVSHTPADESVFAAQKDQIARQLLEQKRQLAFELYSEDLKQRLLKSGELKINEPVLKQLLGSYQRQSTS